MTADPAFTDALNRGLALHRQGKLAEAERAYRAVLARVPNHPAALHLLGIVAQQVGKHEAAIDLFRRAIAIDAAQAEYHHNLGNALLALRRPGEAAEAFAAAARLDAGFLEPHVNLAAALLMDGRSDEAAVAAAVAAQRFPRSPDAHNNSGEALREQGRLDEAIAAFRRATDLNHPYAPSNLLYLTHFHPALDAAAIHAEHRRWAEQVEASTPPGAAAPASGAASAPSVASAASHAPESLAGPLPSAPAAVGVAARSQANDRDPERRLRVGYVSPNLGEHPVGRSMLPIVEGGDRERFEVIFYDDSVHSDAIARRLRAAGAQWHVTAGLTHHQLAELIRQHRIDVLVDLTLHMSRNRLRVFALRPAPVQATFIGYPATTGLRQIDYRITDRFLDPPGETEAFNAEQLVRLPHSFWCYPDDPDAPPLSDLPAGRNGWVTFGSLNNPTKVTEAVVALWARVLQAVPASRLVLSVTERRDPGRRLREMFAAHGVDPARLRFTSRRPRGEYLHQHQEMDVALDPFPYNGHMTSCDALFMGVPVVSLRGPTSVGRGGESLLANLGLDRELLARTPEQYVEIARSLAEDLPRLGRLRATLRDRMRASPLMDAAGFARDVESLYRSMWQRWCRS